MNEKLFLAYSVFSLGDISPFAKDRKCRSAGRYHSYNVAVNKKLQDTRGANVDVNKLCNRPFRFRLEILMEFLSFSTIAESMITTLVSFHDLFVKSLLYLRP